MATQTIQNSNGSYTTYDPASYTPPLPPAPISIGALNQPATPLTIPPTPTSPDYASALNAVPTLQSLLSPTDQTASPAAATQSDLSKRILDLTSQLGGKPQAQATAEANVGLPAYNQQLTDINNQIQSLQKEAQAIPLQVQQDYTGRGATAAGVAPIQSGLLRENSIKALGLSAVAQTLQGNISLAQQQANRAVDLQFAPEQAELDTLTKAYELNKDALAREDAQKATALQAELADRQRQLDNAKQNQSIIYGWVAEAAKNGAPSVTVNQAIQAKTPDQALGLLAPYFQDPNAKAQALADLTYKQAQTGNVKADTAFKYAQAAQAKAMAGAYVNANLITAVQAGQIDPSKVNSRNLPFMSALANAGVDANQLSINAAAAKKVITNLDLQGSQITQAGSALEKNMSLLATLSSKVNTLGIPAADTNLNLWAARFSNQPDIVNYLSTLNTVRSEYAKYIARGAQVDDSIRTEAANAIPVGVNGDTLKSLLTVIQTEGKNVQDSITQAKNNQWTQLSGGTGATATSTTQAVPSGQTTTINGHTYTSDGTQWVLSE